MKIKTVLKNYLYLLLILVFGVVGPLNSIAEAKSAGNVFGNSEESYVAKTIQVVEVVNPASNLTVVSVASPANASGSVGCLTAKFSGSNSVQNQPVMNLNQPASCFRLVTGFLSSPQKVSVQTAPPIKSMVVVATWPVQSVSSSKFNSLPTGSVPFAPAIAFVFISAVWVGFAVKKLTKKINQKESLNYTSNFGLLLVMRC